MLYKKIFFQRKLQILYNCYKKWKYIPKRTFIIPSCILFKTRFVILGIVPKNNSKVFSKPRIISYFLKLCNYKFELEIKTESANILKQKTIKVSLRIGFFYNLVFILSWLQRLWKPTRSNELFPYCITNVITWIFGG